MKPKIFWTSKTYLTDSFLCTAIFSQGIHKKNQLAIKHDVEQLLYVIISHWYYMILYVYIHNMYQ